MKYIRPPEFKSVKEFTEYYKRVERNITELLTKDSGAATGGELNEQLKNALQAAVAYLSGVNKEYTQNELPRAFEEGRNGVPKSPVSSMSKASKVLKKQGYRYAGNAFSRDTYIELQSAVKSAGKDFQRRVNGLIKELRKEGKDSVYNVQEAVKKDLEENGLLTVKYANGAKQPLSAYAAMAARSARIESVNIGAIGRALQAGTDYVKMTTMPQCCKYCGAYQGKVYCISGADKRFPALFKTVLKSGYALPHPNCRHEFIPWFPEMEAPEEVEKAIKDSRIQYAADGSLKDVRYQKDIEGYAAWQAGNRQLNAELLEYQKMQSHYKGREDIPYKSLASFRRARRADELSPAYKAWRNRKKDTGTYKEWKNVIGGKNMPETLEKFQQMKYNKDKKVKREFFLMSREKKLRSESISQEKLPNFKEAIVSEGKTKDYLLNPNHNVGKDKAHVIRSVLGYGQNDYEEFSQLIKSNLPFYKIEKTEKTPYGVKYDVRMVLYGKNARRLELITAWQIDNGTDFPRFITVTFPKKKGDKNV